MEVAFRLLGSFAEEAAVFFLIFLRVGGMFAVIPLFGERSVPQRIRLAVSLAFTALIFPILNTGNIYLQTTKFHDALSEVLVGVAFGLAVRFVVMALQIAGTMAAQSTSLSQIFGNAGLEPLPAIGHMMVVGGLGLAALTGFHIHLLESVLGTYDVFPIGTAPSANALAEWGIERVVQAFKLAFTLASPFIVASLIYNLALGVINKAMPQLMVAFVGAPAITAGSLILLAFSLPVILSIWNTGLILFLADPFGTR